MAIKHPLINSYSEYQSLRFICFPIMNSPVFPSLDDIYCTRLGFRLLFSVEGADGLTNLFLHVICSTFPSPGMTQGLKYPVTNFVSLFLPQTWHKGCFKCKECGMTLNMKNYKGYNKEPYCNA